MSKQKGNGKNNDRPWATPPITPERKFYDEEKVNKQARLEQKRWKNFAKRKKNFDGIYISVQYAEDGKNMRGRIPMSKREYALWLQSNPDEKKQEWRLLYYSDGSLDSLHKTKADRQKERDRISKLSSATYHFDQGSKKKKQKAKVKTKAALQQHSPKSPKKNHQDPKVGENKEESSTKKANKKRRERRKRNRSRKKYDRSHRNEF